MREDYQKRLPSGMSGQVERPSREQDRIDSALQTMCRRLNKVLTAERINLWHQDLGSYRVEGIEYALDAWGRNAKALPVFADIQGLLNTWSATNATTETCGNCDSGWVPAGKDRAGNDAVKRCECMAR